ncbi:hypothetical protein TB1_036939 [Malus domestica]
MAVAAQEQEETVGEGAGANSNNSLSSLVSGFEVMGMFLNGWNWKSSHGSRSTFLAAHGVLVVAQQLNNFSSVKLSDPSTFQTFKVIIWTLGY